MPPSVCFALGLFADLLGPEPPGLTALVLLAVHGVALRRRLQLIRRGFPAVWLHFAGLALLASVGQWALTAALDLRLLPVLPAVLAATLAIGLYPFLSVLLAEAHGTVAAPEQA
jgi:rod shape-determining protein MreD